MSVIITYNVYDLLKITEKLMNILYASEWSTVIEVNTHDYLFNKIKIMHIKILNDSDVNTYKKGASTLFDIANRLTAIQTALTGSAPPVQDVVTIRKCIDRTQDIIDSMSGDSQRHFCIVS